MIESIPIYPIPNTGKRLEIDVNGERYLRIPVRTHVITAGEDIAEVVDRYTALLRQEGDMIFVSERVVAIAQGRAWPIRDITPSPLAKFLVKFVRRSPHGIGLGSSWTMELAIREAGRFRILCAALVSAITKPLGIRGVFYRVVGRNINAIDGPCSYTLPPYNEYAKLGPKNPDKAAEAIRERTGLSVVIIDANDLGVEVLGRAPQTTAREFCRKVFRDNPLGQSKEQTPIAIVRHDPKLLLDFVSRQ